MVLDTKPKELVRCTSGNLVPVHGLLKTRPSLCYGALVEVERGGDGIPINLQWVSIRDLNEDANQKGRR